jgi:transcriptional regulator with XRE-family HTH domain
MPRFPGAAGTQRAIGANQRGSRVSDFGEKAASRLRSILASRGLTLHQVSLESERLYGPESPFRISHTLYHSLANSQSFGPSLPQICALSRISGYRPEDWLEVLGINLAVLGGLQAALPFRRTRLIDPALHGRDFVVHDLREEGDDRNPTVIVPLAQVLQSILCPRSSGWRQGELQPRFARIGIEDAISFPELLPGSIVRLTPRDSFSVPPANADGGRPELLMVEHEGGLWCGRFHLSNDGILYSAASELAYAPVMLRYPQEARILGRVDMEIRWMHRLHGPRVPLVLAGRQHPRILDAGTTDPGTLVRRARRKAGLTLEEASRLSRSVANAVHDQRYAIAQSTLSDYEVQSVPPRHLEKIVTLCLIYGIPLVDFIRAAGAAPESLGHRQIPQERTPEERGASPSDAQLCSSDRREPSAAWMLQHGAIPWFLGGCLAEMSGIAQPSLRDFLWLAGDHPYLPAHTEGSTAALVDRRKKHPARLPGLPGWLQPAYVLLLRNGDYRCACCSLDDQTLFLCPGPNRRIAPEALRLGQDAEVVGQIVALARHIA